MKYLFFIIMILATGVHLFASLKQNKKIRAISKPFILLSILFYYLCITKVVNNYCVLALVFGWLGDILLIPKGTKWFTIGGISFMIGHIFFILAYNSEVNWKLIGIPLMIIVPLIFVGISVLVFRRLKPHLKKSLFYPMWLYLIVNGLMNTFAFYRAISLNSFHGYITLFGALLFFSSDCILFFVRFKKDCFFKTHFWVMLNYSLGELLIVLGLKS